MKSLLRNNLFCLFGARPMTVCNENTIYHSYQFLPNEGWGKSDILSFQCPATGSTPDTLRLFTEVRSRSEHPYRNLYLFIHENLLDPTVWCTDTIAVNLVGSTGGWTDNGRGSIYQTAVFVKSVRPLYPGNYTAKIMHRMQDEKLAGLNDVDIRIKKQGE